MKDAGGTHGWYTQLTCCPCLIQAVEIQELSTTGENGEPFLRKVQAGDSVMVEGELCNMLLDMHIYIYIYSFKFSLNIIFHLKRSI